jgi:hypothetical protein
VTSHITKGTAVANGGAPSCRTRSGKPTFAATANTMQAGMITLPQYSGVSSTVKMPASTAHNAQITMPRPVTARPR